MVSNERKKKSVNFSCRCGQQGQFKDNTTVQMEIHGFLYYVVAEYFPSLSLTKPSFISCCVKSWCQEKDNDPQK